MSRLWVVLKKEVSQQLRDRRAFILLLVPTLIGPLVCLLLLLSQGTNSELDRKELSVSSNGAGLKNSQVLQYISDRLEGEDYESSGQREWNVKWSDSPWDDLVRGKSDVALIREDGQSWKIVPSPMSLDSTALTAEAVVALKDLELPDVDFGGKFQSPPPDNTGAAIPVADFFGEPSANIAIASYLLPVLLISLFTLAGSPVAIECIAAEKEHGTFESLRVSGAPGLSIIMGKLCAVVLASAISGVLALSFLICVGHVRPRGTWNLGMDYVVEAGIGIGAGFTLAILTLSALVLCSAMLLFVSGLAKTIKEAQYWVSLVAFIPVSLGGASVIMSNDHLTRIFEVIPFSNIAIGLSETIVGNYNVWSFAICLAINAMVSLVLVGLSVRMLFGEAGRRTPSALNWIPQAPSHGSGKVGADRR